MIEINITNCIELAKSKSYASKLIPSSMLQGIVEKAIAKELLQKLTEEGVEAIITVYKSDEE